MSLTIGTRLGPYEIVESIGAGGMGEVWRGRDTRLDRDVAIKVLPADFAENPQLLQRFEREARAISSLNHPHICTLYDVGEAREETRETSDSSSSLVSRPSSLHYLVMELIDGESLADRLKEGPLPIREVLRFGQQIALALGAAHRRGITHRDLKPGNIMLTKSGAKLLDFGLAKSAAEGPAPIEGLTNLPTAAKPLTQEGTILGTFQYMAPEQLEGLEADARTDIFALGAVIYEMASGRRAFRGESKTSLIAAIVSSQPEPISSITPMAPPALAHVVRRCLEKDPDDRWQSAQDIASELQWISESGSQAGVAAPLAIRRKSREKLAWLIAGLALVAFVGSSVHWSMTAPEDARTIHLSIPSRTLEYVDSGDGRISPDGRRVAMPVRTPEGQWLIGVRDLGSDSVTMLPDSSGMAILCWSPRGDALAVIHEGRLKVIGVADGTVRDVGPAKGLPRGGTWNENDVILFADEYGIFRASAHGSSTEQIVAPEARRFEMAPMYPLFLADGERFLYVSVTRDPSKERNDYKLRAGRLGSPETMEVGDIGSNVALLDSGHLLQVVDGTLMATPFDEAEFAFTGKPTPIVTGVYYFMPTAGASFDAARDGTIVYRRYESSDSVVLFDRQGSRGEPLFLSGSITDEATISPDGEQVAIAIRDVRTGTSDIWLYGMSRSTRHRITIHPTEEAGPVWTPSGDILFYSDRLRRPDIFMRSMDGTGEERLIVGTDELEFTGDVSPDGRHLLYTRSDRDSQYDLWIADLDGSTEPRPLAVVPGRQGQGRFSPDGRMIAYASEETGGMEVWVRPFPGPGRVTQISTEGAYGPAWDANVAILYFVQEKAVWEVDLSTSETLARPKPRFLFEIPERITGFDVTADGRFLMSIADESLQEPNYVIVNWRPSP